MHKVGWTFLPAGLDARGADKGKVQGRWVQARCMTVLLWWCAVALQENRETPPQRGRSPRCIILAPTRELAKQVEKEFQESAPGLTVGCYYGGAQ
jgi:hypothetical protein